MCKLLGVEVFVGVLKGQLRAPSSPDFAPSPVYKVGDSHPDNIGVLDTDEFNTYYALMREVDNIRDRRNTQAAGRDIIAAQKALYRKQRIQAKVAKLQSKAST